VIQVKYFDVHCHLDSPKYTKLDELIARNKENGIVGIVAAASNFASCQSILGLGKKYGELVFPALGVHPERLDATKDDVDKVMNLARKHREEIVAIGEVGLPYYSIREKEDFVKLMEKAVPTLKRFSELALELDLAVVLHAPHDEPAQRAVEIVNDVGLKRVLFHWHKSKPEITKRIVDKGYYMSITPEVCYRDRDRELVKFVPLRKLVLETDGPWAYGGEFKDRLTEPFFIKRTSQEVAKLKNLTEKEVSKITTENASKLFNVRKLISG
jgi:TatD DNase family protein